MNSYYVYLHLKADDGAPFYVGKGKGRRSHDFSHRNRYWKFVAKKHGVIVELVHINLTESEAFKLEIATINLLGKHNLCNFSEGGDGPSGHKHSEESKLKMRIKGRHSEEGKMRIGKARKTRGTSEETRAKFSIARKGLKLSAEWRRKIGDAGQKAVKTMCGKCFVSAKLAAEWLKNNGYPKADPSSIAKCCKGKLRYAYDHVWTYDL